MTFAILIELPDFIKNELLRICLGLPSAEWQTEENLYIVLRSFGKLSDQDHWDIVDHLGEIEAMPFALKINHLEYSPKRKNFGILWAAFESTILLENLKININNQLSRFNQFNHEMDLQKHPAIRLGSLQKESPERLADYFAANGEFTSSAFEVREFVLAQLHHTNKRSFYSVEKRYLLG